LQYTIQYNKDVVFRALISGIDVDL